MAADKSSKGRWCPPPNWPTPQAGWSPPPGWQPLTEWGPAPPGWEFWPDEPSPDQQDAAGRLAAKAAASVQRAKETLTQRQVQATSESGRRIKQPETGQPAAPGPATAAPAVAGEVLFAGMSHDAGRNARVTLYADRLERVQDAKMTALNRAKQDTEVIPVRAISSVQATKDGMRYTKVTAYAAGNNIEFRFGHDQAQRFKDALLALVLAGPSQQPPAAPAPIAAPDIVGQLRQLGQLREAGVLSEQEFADKKAVLLRRL